MRFPRLLVPWLVVGAFSGGGCSSDSSSGADTSAASGGPSATSAEPPVSSPIDATRAHPVVREGSALARGVGESALYVADEDHRVVRRIPLPLRADAASALELPGAPAQVLPLSGRVLVT